MTVAELIEELKRQPQHLPVKVLLSSIRGGYDNTGQFVDDHMIDLELSDAIEAHTVTFEGNFVLVESK